LRLIDELKRAGYNLSMYVSDKDHRVVIIHANIRNNSNLKPRGLSEVK
jgi:hypothetical protein